MLAGVSAPGGARAHHWLSRMDVMQKAGNPSKKVLKLGPLNLLILW
jgi:hypothetical protein